MMEVTLIYSILFFVMIIQTIVGVGVLVIGTPILLLLDINLIDAISILLPISITTSLFNLIYFWKKNKIRNEIIEHETKKYFFYCCLPCIFAGLYILKLTNDYFNYNYIVGTVIILSVILASKFNAFTNINKLSKILFLSIIGIVHGLTNSGGTLLSIFISNKNNKMNSRYNITFFYFFLAFFQLFLFLLVFTNEELNKNYLWAILFCPVAGFIGNIIQGKISENKFKKVVNLIAIFASISLFLK